MYRFTVSSVWALFVSALSLCHAVEAQLHSAETKNVLKVQLTHGPGGPKREPNIFPGETVFMRIELSKDIFSSNETDLTCEVSLVSQTDETRNFRYPVFPLQSVKIKDTSPIFHYLIIVPSNFEEGKYDLGLSIKNGSQVVCAGKETVDLYSTSKFGYRNLWLMHGIPGTMHWVAGSNVFVAGATAQIRFGVGGLSIKDDEIAMNVRLVFIDKEQEDVSVVLNTTLFRDKSDALVFAELKSAWVTSQFPLTQPGNFILKIEVDDLNSSKKEFYELPIFVFDPNEYSVPSMPVRPISSDRKSTISESDSVPKSEAVQ